MFLSIILLLSACSVQADSDSLSQSASQSSVIPEDSTSQSDSTQQPSEPEIVINPYTGELADESFDPYARAVTVMVNNVYQSLPQRGLSEADIIYEVVTEGGITRLMAVYSQGYDLPTIGPVRSSRDQFVQLMLSYEPLHVHIGSSVTADHILELYNYQEMDIDGQNISDIVWYDEERADTLSQLYENVGEHCWFTDGELIEDVVAQNGYSDRLTDPISPVFNFLPTGEERVLGLPATDVHVKFSDYSHSDFVYDEVSGKYDKFIYGEPQMDENVDEQLEFENVFILFTTIDTYSDGILANVSYSFGGVGYYFSGGNYESVHWRKGDVNQPLRIVSVDGHETPIDINPGNSFVGVVDLSHFGEFEIK